jgi:hypothetical protein
VISVPRLGAAASATASDDKSSIEALESRFHDAFIAKDVNALMEVRHPPVRLRRLTAARQDVGWRSAGLLAPL